ncbi:hypothetical protein P3T39_002397 [Kitasatospora sp. GP82]|nr:hypothetical protein [Kitasatospora sp. GP82]
MTDQRGLTCEQLREIGAELALGVLPAEERAGAMDHLERCPACREHVHELVLTADALLDLVPGSEPPVGFEERVLDRLGLSSARPPRHRVPWRRIALAVAAAAAGLALVHARHRHLRSPDDPGRNAGDSKRASQPLRSSVHLRSDDRPGGNERFSRVRNPNFPDRPYAENGLRNPTSVSRSAAERRCDADRSSLART